jgi:signal transduction histidine kinase
MGNLAEPTSPARSGAGAEDHRPRADTIGSPVRPPRSLGSRIHRLRLPLALGMVLFATLHHILLRASAVEVRLGSMLLVYGLAVPVAAWLLLGWLARVAEQAEAADRERARTAARLEQRNRQIEALYTAGRLLAGARSVGQLLEPLAELACRLTLARAGGLVWYADESADRRTVTVGDASETPRELPTGRDSLDWLAQAHPPLLDGVRCLPIHTGREALGLLWLKEPDLDSATQQSLNTLLAEIVASWSARRTEGRAVAAMRRLGSSFRTREDARELLHKFTELVADALGAVGVAILRIHEGRYRPQAAWGSVQVAPPKTSDAARAEPIWAARAGRVIYASAGEDSVLALTFEAPKPLTAQDLQLLRVLGAEAGLLVQITESWGALTWQERGRLAGELHDGLSQMLAYIHLHSKHAQSALEERREGALNDSLAELSRAALEAYEEVRRTIDDLRLMPGPEETAAQFLTRLVHARAERDGLEAEVTVPEGLRWPAEVAAQLTRFVQEAMTNAARHGQARRVTVELRWGEPVVLSVSDDGTGFDPGGVSARGHHGLAVMRERIEGLGGSLEIDSGPGHGATLRARLPAWGLELPSPYRRARRA